MRGLYAGMDLHSRNTHADYEMGLLIREIPLILKIYFVISKRYYASAWPDPTTNLHNQKTSYPSLLLYPAYYSQLL